MLMKRNQNKPEDFPAAVRDTCPLEQAIRPSIHQLLCSCLCLYRANLPTMTPMTKKSTQSARRRVLRPSSLMVEVTMVEEEV